MFAHLLHQETHARTPRQSRTISAQPERIEKRQLERSISWTSPERLQRLILPTCIHAAVWSSAPTGAEFGAHTPKVRAIGYLREVVA